TLAGVGAREPVVFDYRPEAGSLLPVAGDWDGDGKDTVGLYSPATHTFYLKRKNSKNRKADTVVFDPGPGDWIPVAGDWNRDGTDTVGVYDPATATFMLRDENSSGEPDATMTIEGATASAALVPGAGDWDYEVGDVVVPGHKEAFCWLDSQRIIGNRDMQFRDCNTNQGLTAGWCDIYIRNTDCQWIDITGLAPGNYQLTVTVNPAGLIRESDPTNNSASVKVHVPEPRRLAKAP